MKRLTPILFSSLFALTACHSTSYLDQRYPNSRANLTDTQLPNNPRPAPHVDIQNPEPTTTTPTLELEPRITGTWTFSAPRTVTETSKKTGEVSQYSLFNGRPAPSDTPIVVITVGPANGDESIAQSDPATYKITGTRSYVLNGNIAKEWTGTASTGAAFSELILHRPGSTSTDDVCHAFASARTTEERTIALNILTSLTWTAAPAPAQ